MAERLAPDALLVNTNLVGTVAAIQDDPDTPDGAWLTAADVNGQTDLRVSFPTPAEPLAATQNFRLLVRRAGGTNDAVLAFELYVSGTFITGRAQSEGTITSTAGQIIDWSPVYDFTGADPTAVEIRAVAVSQGGKASAKSTLEYGALEWNVANSLPADIAGAATLTADSSLAPDGIVQGPPAASLVANASLTAVAARDKLHTITQDFKDLTSPAFTSVWRLPATAFAYADSIQAFTGGTLGPCVMITDVHFDATESSASIEIRDIGAPPADMTNAQAGLQVRISDPDTGAINNALLLMIYPLSNEVRASYLSNGVFDASVAITYDKIQHRFLRLRHTADTWHWETSPDFTTWTAFRSVAAPTGDYTDAFPAIQISHGAPDDGSIGGWAVEYDSFNLPSDPANWVDADPWLATDVWGGHTSGPVTVQGTATLTSTSSLATSGTGEALASAPLAATSSLSTSATSFSIVDGPAAFVAEASLSTSGEIILQASAALDAESSLLVTGTQTSESQAQLTASSSLTIAAALIVGVGAELVADAAISATGAVAVIGSVALSANSLLSTSATRTALAAVSLIAESSLVTDGEIGLGGGAALVVSSSLTVAAILTALAETALVAAASLASTADAIGLADGSAALLAEAVLVASGSRTLVGSIGLIAAATLAVAGLRVSSGSFPPNTLLDQVNLSGTLATIQDDPDSPDESVMTATDATQATDLRVGFPTPPGTLAVGAGLQVFRVRLRKSVGV